MPPVFTGRGNQRPNTKQQTGQNRAWTNKHEHTQSGCFHGFLHSPQQKKHSLLLGVAKSQRKKGGRNYVLWPSIFPRHIIQEPSGNGETCIHSIGVVRRKRWWKEKGHIDYCSILRWVGRLTRTNTLRTMDQKNDTRVLKRESVGGRPSIASMQEIRSKWSQLEAKKLMTPT